VRYPNLYASIAATINFVVRSLRQFAECIGKLMFWCGEDKIIYSSETPIWHPKWPLDAFWDFEIPQDLVEGYGYPQLTEMAKRKILGESLLKLSGMDVEETKRKLT
jgi:predicted TIM-barrel fold metal-dependent hydrolase